MYINCFYLLIVGFFRQPTLPATTTKMHTIEQVFAWITLELLSGSLLSIKYQCLSDTYFLLPTNTH